MSVPFIKTSFAAGEVTPSLFGHVDLARFALGASTERNCFTSYRGGAYSRAGSAFVGYSKQTGRTVPPRLIPFQFSINEGRPLEFGNLYMRAIANGAFITEAARAIANITRANPCVITSAVHGFANGDSVFIGDVAGMTQLNGHIYIAAGVTANTLMITDIFGNVISSAAFSPYLGAGSIARVFTLNTPYAEEDLPYLKYTQSADVMSLGCWNQVTGTSYPPFDLSRQADNAWTLTQIDPQPTVAAPASCSASASAAGTSDFQYVVTAVNPDDGTESIASPIGDAPNSVNIGSTLGSLTVNWAGVVGVNQYKVYKATPVFGGAVPPGAIFGYAGTAFGTQFSDNNITPDFSTVPPTFTDPFAPGAINSVSISAGGSGLSAVTWAITTATGSGFDGTPVVVGGQLTGFIVKDRGKNYRPGDSIAFDGAGFATGAIAFTLNPANGDTITLNGDVWTFVTTPTAANQTQIKASLALTMVQLVSDLSASLDAELTVAGYTQVTSNTLVIAYGTPGVAGDAYTLASSSLNGVRSGPVLTGGSGTAGADPAATLNIGPLTGTYPSVPSYFQERRVYAASPNNPDTYWMSQPGAFTNFDKRIPTIDSDAITGTPWSVQVNGIQFMVPMPGGLVTLTGLSAWQVAGAGGSSLNPQPITPSNQQAQPQAYNGCSATIPPIKIGFDILYVQAKGSIVRDLAYNVFVNIYTGQDITVLSSHLFTGFMMREWAWCEEPFKLIWTVRDDGVMLSLTFLKEQEVNAWTRHDTLGLYQSVCSVTELPVDALYCATQRFTPQAAAANDNCYMIERLDDRLWQTVEDVWAVDAALELEQGQPNATITASSAAGAGKLTGVVGLVGGQNYSNATTGSVFDDNGDGPGTGAVPVLTIVGGVITAITFPPGNQGQNYIRPKLNVVDPTGAGAGASANPVLDNTVTFATSADVFGPGSVGDVVRMGGGCAVINSFMDARHVTGLMRSPIAAIIPNSGSATVPAVPLPQSSGNWTLTTPVNKITGLNHLIGMTATGLADGQVIAPQVVADDGSITLPGGVTASAVVVGLGFQAQLQSVYLNEGQPTIQGQRKKISAVTARVELSRGLKIGANQPDGSTLSPALIAPPWNNLNDVPDIGQAPYLPPAPYPYLAAGSLVPPTPLYTGDVRIPVKSGFQKPGQVAMQQDNPLPMQILAFIPEVLPGDQAEVKVQDRKQSGRANQEKQAA